MSTNKKWLFGGIGWAVLVVVGVLILVHYESQPDETILRTSLLLPYITNNRGQRVESVPYQDLGTWVRWHNNAKIVSLVSVNDGMYGHTTAFIVVYEVEVPIED